MENYTLNLQISAWLEIVKNLRPTNIDPDAWKMITHATNVEHLAGVLREFIPD